jgi:hypothetical protein
MIDEKKLIEETQKCFVNNSIHKNDLAEVIANLPKVGKWIPCSERFPEKNGSYLVSYKEAITNCHGICVKYWSCEEQLWRPCNYAPSVYWKAWMPLPAPYKESED